MLSLPESYQTSASPAKFGPDCITDCSALVSLRGLSSLTSELTADNDAMYSRSNSDSPFLPPTFIYAPVAGGFFVSRVCHTRAPCAPNVSSSIHCRTSSLLLVPPVRWFGIVVFRYPTQCTTTEGIVIRVCTLRLLPPLIGGLDCGHSFNC